MRHQHSGNNGGGESGCTYKDECAAAGASTKCAAAQGMDEGEMVRAENQCYRMIMQGSVVSENMQAANSTKCQTVEIHCCAALAPVVDVQADS